MVLNVVDGWVQVYVFSLQESDIDDFDDCILEAVFSSGGSLGNKLKQGDACNAACVRLCVCMSTCVCMCVHVYLCVLTPSLR